MASINVVVSFRYSFAFRSIAVNGFTNYLKNIEEFVEKHNIIFSKIIPNVSTLNIMNLKLNKANHTHPLNNSKKDLSLKIIKELIKDEKGYTNEQADRFIDNNGFMMNDFWQLSFATSDGIRLIGYFVDNNIFEVLFIDYHHLIEPDIKYNQPDYKNYNYCPYKGGDR